MRLCMSIISGAVLLLLVGCGSDTRQDVSLAYTVNAGESLSDVGRKSGLSVSDIIRYNDLDSHVLRAGQRLYLPGISTLPEVVAKPEKQQEEYIYRLVTRAQWGAQPSKANFDPMSLITRITIHHTDDEMSKGQSWGDKEIVRRIQRHHQKNNNWADIGYHFLIGSDGRVYEGRPLTVQGAHARGANNIANIGVSLIGDFDKQLPGAAQMRGLRALLTDLQQRYGIENTRVYGHDDFVTTVCPGERLKAWIDDYRKR